MFIQDQFKFTSNQINHVGIHQAVRDDVMGQLNLLMYSGFIRFLSLGQIKAIPRYLKAIEYRLDKKKDDQKVMQELNKYWKTLR